MVRNFRAAYAVIGLAIALALTSCVASDVGSTNAALPSQDRYIVVLQPGANPTAVAASAGAAPTHVYQHALVGFAAPLPPSAVTALQRNPNVLFVEADRKVEAYDLPTGVDRIDAELNTIAGIDGAGGAVDVDVAVIDTGVDDTHPELTVAMKTDCARGGPFNGSCRDGEGSDGNGHGTHVAGTIGAKDDGVGVVGVAPGARIWAARVLDNRGSGYNSWVIAGIDWVAEHAADIEVANMSLGGSGTDDTDGGDCHASTDAMNLAICNTVDAGVVFVVAAGNETDDAANHTPAAYDQVITVSALADFDGQPGGLSGDSVSFSSCTEAEDDSLACFSNYGPDVDIMAPGLLITSTAPGGGLATMSGTSMASPHVAGAAALYVVEHGAPTDAAGVAAVREGLIALGKAQDSGFGLTTDDDPDAFDEPLLYVASGCTADADCDDGVFCNGAETCDAGACAAGEAPSCDDGVECTVDVCDATIDACSSAADDAACDDGLFCNGAETCDAALGCQTGASACGAAACDETGDMCGCLVDSDCDDGLFCNGAEACDASGWCASGTAVSCDDGVSCTTDSCSEGTDTCDATPDDSACDDGDTCTADYCDAAGGCGAAPISNCCGDSVCDTGETQCGCSADCGAPPATETSCTDGGDDDCDGFVDCDDSDCAGDAACPSTVCGNGTCEGNGEDCSTCSSDCRCAGGPSCGRGCCGDGSCDGSENGSNCPIDCA